MPVRIANPMPKHRAALVNTLCSARVWSWMLFSRRTNNGPNTSIAICAAVLKHCGLLLAYAT